MEGWAAYLMKVDGTGDKLWERTYQRWVQEADGSRYRLFPRANSLCPTGDGGFLVAGLSDHFVPARTSYFLKVDREGREIWHRTRWGCLVSSAGRAIARSHDGGFVVGMYDMRSDTTIGGYHVLKLDEEGHEVWKKNWAYFPLGIVRTGERGFMVIGSLRMEKRIFCPNIVKFREESITPISEFLSGFTLGALFIAVGCTLLTPTERRR